MTGHQFGYSVVASTLHDAHAVALLTAPVRELLDDLGGVADDPGGIGGADSSVELSSGPHVFVVATGGTERLLLNAIAERRLTHPAEPTVLVAHRAHNSLAASLETLAAIQQAGGRGHIVSLTDRVETDRQMLDEAVGDLEAVAAMQTARLGVVGGPSSWLVASSPDPDVVRRRWGPEVVTVEPTRMIELTRTPVTPTGLLVERFTKVADPVRSTVDRRAVDAAMGVRSALLDVLDTHFESGIGVGISGQFALQPVTLIRLGGVDLDECWIAEGDIVATGDDTDLCRTQVTIALSSGNVGDLLTHPLGNHLVLAAGHHERRLRSWWNLAISTG